MPRMKALYISIFVPKKASTNALHPGNQPKSILEWNMVRPATMTTISRRQTPEARGHYLAYDHAYNKHLRTGYLERRNHEMLWGEASVYLSHSLGRRSPSLVYPKGLTRLL